MRSCTTRSTNLNGPAQIGFAANLSPASFTAFALPIMPARSVSCAISGENGALSESRTVSGSATSTLSICDSSALRNEPCMFMCRSSVNLTASASNGSPSWNLTPPRSLIVTVFPSSDVSCESASCGTMLSFASMSNSLSHIAASTMRPTYEPAVVGSRLSGSSARPMRRLPCAAADEAAANANKAPSQRLRGFTVRLLFSRGAILFGDCRRDAGFDRVAVERPVRVRARRHKLDGVDQPLAADAFEPRELSQRIGVIVDAQAHRGIFLGRPDSDGGRLLAALVPARGFARRERRDQPPRAGCLVRCLERMRGRRNDVGPGQHVAGPRHAGPHHVAAPVDATRAGMHRDGAACIVDMKLALLGPLVRRDEVIDHGLRRHALAQQAHAAVAPQRVRQRLRGECADAAFAVRADRADREELARDRDAVGAAGIARDDGPRHGSLVVMGGRDETLESGPCPVFGCVAFSAANRYPLRRKTLLGLHSRQRRDVMQPVFTTRPDIRGTFGAIATTHWLATQTGMAVLERGGNAFDAAAAAGFVLQIVEPHLNRAGGALPAIVLPAGAAPEVICGQGP